MYVSGWLLVSIKIDNLKELTRLHNYDDYSFGVQWLVADMPKIEHDLGILHDALNAMEFKEEMSFDYNGERRWLYSINSNNSRVKELYSVVHAFHKLPLTLQGLGFESFNPNDGHIIYGRGGNGKMSADMLWTSAGYPVDDYRVEIVKKITKALNAKEKMMLQFSSASLGNAMRKIDDIISKASAENEGN